MSRVQPITGTEGVDGPDSRACQAAEALIDDYHRQGDRLEQAQVERVLDRRGLDAAECTYVYECLEKRGIEIDLPVEADPDEDIGEFGNIDVALCVGEGNARDKAPAIAWILSVAGSEPLLTPRQEVELGPSIVAAHDESETVDIVWFATGGGKTETYLGLIITAALHDRLTWKASGITAWSRFPLRMLSLQQTQRFADAVAGAERIHGKARLHRFTKQYAQHEDLHEVIGALRSLRFYLNLH